ncbi:ribokinase [Exaiptasia diaphana]|uniref:Ribokinase n=1 Tax=Exaiptasia diaphana TaxID=2652724 RepID=A0A913XRV7_EXADI|nr:ribokinase [Exaiptasia diaphana]KXJ24825.1 Ribokinase [Exaiptasia diaphana]
MAADKGPFDVVVVGSCMTDLVSYVPRLPKAGETIHGTKFSMGFGGKGANQCVMASRLGAKTAMVAKVGDDTFGRNHISNFKHNKVNVDHVSLTTQAFTGVAPISVNSSGENSITIVSGANEYLTDNDIKSARSTIVNSAVVVTQLEIQPNITQLALALAKNANVTTVFNPAPASPWLDIQFYRLSDVFCANESEAELLTGVPVKTIDDAEKAVVMLLERGVGKVVITMGPRGAVIGTQTNPIPEHIAVTPVDAVDTTGAGDAFIGALAFYLAKFKNLTFKEMVKRSNEVARTTVFKRGTQTSFPTCDSLPPSFFSNTNSSDSKTI